MIRPILFTDYSVTHTKGKIVTEHKQDDTHCFRVSVSALIIEDTRVLLAHRRAIDWWNLPGGAVDPGETVAAGLRREVREETGLEVEVGQLVGVYSKPMKQEVVLSFRCRVTGGTLGATNDDDIDE